MRIIFAMYLLLYNLQGVAGQSAFQLLASLDTSQSATVKVELLDSLSMTYLQEKKYLKAVAANLEGVDLAEKSLKDKKITHNLRDKLVGEIFEAIPPGRLKALEHEMDGKYRNAKLYNGLSFYFRKKDRPYSTVCAEKALNLSTQSSDSLLAHENIGYSFLGQFNFAEAEPHFKNALEASIETKDTFMIIRVQRALAELYTRTYKLDKAMECLTQAMDLHRKWPYSQKKTIWTIQNGFAYVCQERGDLDKTIQIRKEIIEVVSAEQDSHAIVFCYANLASDLLRKGDLYKSLSLLRKSHEWILRNSPEGLPFISLDLGECYYEMGVYDTALIYLQEAIDYAKEYETYGYACDGYQLISELYFVLGDTVSANDYDEKAYDCHWEHSSIDLNTSAKVYEWTSGYHQRRGHLDSALVAIDKGLELIYENGIDGILPGLLIRKGELLYEKKMYERTGQVLGEAQQAAREHGLSKDECDASYLLAMALSELKQYPEALEHALQAEEVAKEINYSKRLQDIYKLLAVTHHRLGDGEQAYLYHLKYTELKDSLYGFVQKDRLARYETLFQLKEKEMEKELLEMEKERQGAVLKRRTLLLVAAGVAILLLTVASLLYIRWSKTRAQKLLRSQIAKDIHDDVGGILNYMYITAKDAMEQSPDIPVVKDKLQKAIALNDQAVVALRNLIWKTENKPVPLANFADRLRAYTNNIFEDISIPYSLKINGFDADRKLPSDTQYHFFMMYKEALNNAIKHGEGGPINIGLLHQDRGIELTVSNPFLVPVEQGTDSYGGGHGLKNMRERAAALKGDIEFSEESDTFTVRLKIKTA
ncbi:MAG: hypothetical protein R2830_07960 [Saprospiraceae bacterium]